jgi:hypothetical protein
MPLRLLSTVEKVDADDESKLDYDLAQANEESIQQVRVRLERRRHVLFRHCASSK